MDCLNGAIIFTSLDLKAGYWQVEMEENSIPYSAFTVGPLDFYECVHMPFGLTNTPATFQHLMESCLGDYHLKYCIIYLDDIIIFSKTPKEHISRLHKVFQKLDEAGLHLKPNKCEFFRDRLEYLGHVVLSKGIETNSKKIAAILNWPQPRNITQIRCFLGFCNYYRKFIKGYAQVAKPLYQLLTGENAKKKTKEKFMQNKPLLEMLKNTGSLIIAEASKDKTWGTGIPLHDTEALCTSKWKNKGWLSSMLMSIRDEVMSSK